jgi:hypothetical protein
MKEYRDAISQGRPLRLDQLRGKSTLNGWMIGRSRDFVMLIWPCLAMIGDETLGSAQTANDTIAPLNPTSTNTTTNDLPNPTSTATTPFTPHPPRPTISVDPRVRPEPNMSFSIGPGPRAQPEGAANGPVTATVSRDPRLAGKTKAEARGLNGNAAHKGNGNTLNGNTNGSVNRNGTSAMDPPTGLDEMQRLFYQLGERGISYEWVRAENYDHVHTIR